MRRLYSVPNTNGSLQFYVPSGLYKFFVVEYDLTAATGVTLTRADLGNVKLNFNGQDVINVDAEILSLLGNIYGGVSEFKAVSGGATRCTLFIPCGQYWDSANIYHVSQDDKVYIDLSFPDLALSSNVASGNIRVYAKTGVGVMNYINYLQTRPVVAGGAGVIDDSFPVNNVSQVILKSVSTLLSNVQIRKDNEPVFDGSVNVLTAYSDFVHLLESTNSTLVLEMGESKDVREYSGHEIGYQYTFKGAGTLAQYFMFIEYTNQKALASRQATVNYLQRKMS